MRHHAPRMFTEHPEERGKRVGSGASLKATEYWEMFCSGKSLGEISKEVGVTRERVRQVLSQHYPEEYSKQKEINQVNRRIERFGEYLNRKSACKHCHKDFSNPKGTKKFCSMECYRKHVTFYEYPSWVAGRSINKKNFTKEEWRFINTFRTRNYYRRHREKQRARARAYQRRNKDRLALYHKRYIERKVYGYAVTPLPGGSKNKAATKK